MRRNQISVKKEISDKIPKKKAADSSRLALLKLADKPRRSGLKYLSTKIDEYLYS